MFLVMTENCQIPWLLHTNWRCTDEALADYWTANNWRFGRYRLIQKNYFAVLFKLFI